jgi:hypothetical protein
MERCHAWSIMSELSFTVRLGTNVPVLVCTWLQASLQAR